MKAVATDGRSGLEVVELPRPEPPEGGGLVRVLACGLCGSDLEKLSGAGARPGRILGHEVVGLLETPGQTPTRVALAHHVPCGRCIRCRSGHSSLCEQFVSSDLVPGGFAEFLTVSRLHLADAVFALPAEIDDLAGTLLEPLSCVLRALDTANSLLAAYPQPDVRGRRSEQSPGPGPDDATRYVGEGDRNSSGVLVAGCGAVGLLFLSALAAGALPEPQNVGPAIEGLGRHRRPSDLFFLEPQSERAALARGLGARSLAEGRPEGSISLAIITAPAALPEVVEAMAPGGVVLVFAAGQAAPALDLDLLYRRELTLAGVRSGSPAHLRGALDLLAGGRLELDWLQPLVVGMEELPAAVRSYADGKVLKVVVRP